jgi:cytochrome c peroxidase
MLKTPLVARATRTAMLWAGALVVSAALGVVRDANAQPAATKASDPAVLDFTAQELAQIAAHGPWPPPMDRDASNRVDGQRAAQDFGRRLFFDMRLSANGRQSCATCHFPGRGFQDGQSTARSGGIRNTPSLWDAAQQRWYGWGGTHDSLWAASLTPLLAKTEMANNVPAIAALARRDAALRTAYRAAFAQELPADDTRLVVDLTKALAAYQSTLVSPRTPFDEFRDALQRGDRRAAATYPIAAQRGLRLFIGAGRCSVCHAGPRFSNGEFADIGIPFFVPGGVDPGRHAGLGDLLTSPMNRLGKYNDAGTADPRAVATRHLLREHRHFGEFKVPGLRQLMHTAPYMHNGSLATIEDVVRHYDRLDEERLHADGERILRPLSLQPAEAADLAAFLRSLSR